MMAASRESKADATIGDPTKEKGRASIAGLGWFRVREAGKEISETERSEVIAMRLEEAPPCHPVCLSELTCLSIP